MEFESKRILIRPVTIDDKHEIFVYRSDAETNKYQGWVPVTIDDVESFIKNTSKQFNEPGTWFQFVIITKYNNKIIGDIGIHFLEGEGNQVEIGCTLNKDFQNQGYATESLQTIIDYLFVVLDKQRIIASLDPENINSIRLVERLGFKKEAHHIKSLFINGKWVDDLIYYLEKER
jgi:RimJ/RimL family protein N-acetyltransferase